MAKLFLALSVLMILTRVPRVGAQYEYCSLTVKVQDSKGVPVDVRVHAIKPDGGVLDELTSEGGTVRFCDLGIAPVTVSIGSEDCKLLTMKNVPLRWQIEKTLVITYEPCHYEGPDAMPSSGCRVLIRAVDQDGVVLPGARVVVNRSVAKIDLTDRFGRTFFVVGDGAEVTGEVRRTGYAIEGFSFDAPPTQGGLTRLWF
jgi:hypothetical protein